MSSSKGNKTELLQVSGRFDLSRVRATERKITVIV